MTSNIGSHIIQSNFEKMTPLNHDEVIEQTKEEVFDLLKKSVRPEFLNRIDELVMFRPLSRGDIRKIVNIQFRHIQQRLEEAGIQLVATDEVLDYLGEQGFDPQFGARPLKRVIQRQVLNELSKEILSGKINKDSVVEAVLDGGKIRFNNIDVEIPTER